jgi:hypothetical protein
MKRSLFCPFIAAILVCFFTIHAQEHPSGDQSAHDLVRKVVDNELNTLKEDHTHWIYQLETDKAGVRERVEVVETTGGDLTRLVARDGQPLTDQQRTEENSRTEKFLNDVEEQRKRQHDQNDDERKIVELFTLLPDALNFSYAEHNGSTVKLNFVPNPGFHPPSREAHAFHEMEGQLIVDEDQKRLAEIHGHLKDAVHFGILGHLDPGGTFDVRQQEVAPNHWEMTLLKVNMKGKALFFKTINVQQNESRSHFRQVPDNLTLPQAWDLLQKQATLPTESDGQ